MNIEDYSKSALMQNWRDIVCQGVAEAEPWPSLVVLHDSEDIESILIANVVAEVGSTTVRPWIRAIFDFFADGGPAGMDRGRNQIENQ